MDKKGQIFSLDFLLSMSLIVLALGLALNFMELNIYNLNDEQAKRELRAIGETAADLLMNNPETACMLVENVGVDAQDSTDDPIIGNLSGCVIAANKTTLNVPGPQWPPPIPLACPGGWWCAPGQQKKLPKFIGKQDLGIPNNYNCLLEFESTAPGFGCGNGDNICIITLDCLDDPSGAADLYSLERKVVVYNGDSLRNITKKELDDCIYSNGACALLEGTAKLKVWKA